MNDEYQCITATIAFGMGINKANVRAVIHYGCPQNLNHIIKKSGRAGRDGNESACHLYYKQKDFIIQQRFINDITDQNYKLVKLNLLQQISRYVNAKTCRRRIILEYFGQKTTIDNCAKCDNCCRQACGQDKNVIKSIDKNDQYKLFQVVGVIHQLNTLHNYSCGPSLIGQILKGSSSKRIKNWMKELHFFGSMNTQTLKNISTLITKTLDLDLIESYDAG